MPRAPPISLLASLVALPTPALSSGTASITRVVEGAIVSPIPTPRSRNVAPITGYAVPTSTVVNRAMPRDTRTSPVVTTFLLPNLSTSLSLFAATGPSPRGSGRNRMAASRAVLSRTSWKCSIWVNMKENITKNANMIAMRPIVKPLSPKSPIGSRGCSTLLSHVTKAVMSNTPSAATPRVSLLSQPCVGASMIAYRIDPRPKTDSKAPRGSRGLRCSSLELGTRNRPRRRARAMIGTLIQKTICQS